MSVVDVCVRACVYVYSCAGERCDDLLSRQQADTAHSTRPHTRQSACTSDTDRERERKREEREQLGKEIGSEREGEERERKGTGPSGRVWHLSQLWFAPLVLVVVVERLEE